MPEKLDDKACKNIIRCLSNKLGIEPKIIVTKLLSEEDKEDMRKGYLTSNILECHLKVWVASGMPNYLE